MKRSACNINPIHITLPASIPVAAVKGCIEDQGIGVVEVIWENGDDIRYRLYEARVGKTPRGTFFYHAGCALTLLVQEHGFQSPLNF